MNFVSSSNFLAIFTGNTLLFYSFLGESFFRLFYELCACVLNVQVWEIFLRYFILEYTQYKNKN